jgi:hypothetical protein
MRRDKRNVREQAIITRHKEFPIEQESDGG